MTTKFNFLPGSHVTITVGQGHIKHGTVQRISENRVYVKHFNGEVIGYKTELVKPAFTEQAQPKLQYGDKTLVKEIDVIKQVLEGKTHTVPKTEKEKDLADMAHPKGKITHKDVLVARGVLAKEEEDCDDLEEANWGYRNSSYDDDEDVGYTNKRDFKRKELEFELRHEKEPSRTSYRPAAKISTAIHHNVPFAQRDQAKKEGMKWDPNAKKWYHTSQSASDASKFPKTVKEEVELEEGVGATDYAPKSQGGTRKELIAKYLKTKHPKDAEAARKAGASQKELQGMGEEVEGMAKDDLSELNTRTLVNYVPKAGDSLKSLSPEKQKKRQDSMIRATRTVMRRPDGGDEIARYRSERKQGMAEGLGDIESHVVGKYKGWTFAIDRQEEDDRYVDYYLAISPHGKEISLPKRTTTAEFKRFVDQKGMKEEVELHEAKVGDTISFHHELKAAPGTKVKKSGTVEKVENDTVHVKVKDKYGVKRHQVKMSDIVKEEVELDESLAVHGKYTIRTGPVIRDIPEHKPEHVVAHNTRLKKLGVVADAEPGGGNYGSTHRVTVTNNETNEKTHHHVYQSDLSGKKAMMSVRGVGQKNDLHGEHNKVIKDYLSGKKATSNPVQEEVELEEATMSYDDWKKKLPDDISHIDSTEQDEMSHAYKMVQTPDGKKKYKVGTYHHGAKSGSVKESADPEEAIDFKKEAAKHMKDLHSKESTPANKAYAQKMLQRALEAAKIKDPEAAKKHYQGVSEELDEAMSSQQRMDFNKMLSGAIGRDQYNAKWKTPSKSSSKQRSDVSKVVHGAMGRDQYNAKRLAKEEAEQIDEMTQGKSYTQKQIMSKVQSGNWEAMSDVKPGKHVEMRHHTGKKVTVHVKEEVELDENYRILAQKGIGAERKEDIKVGHGVDYYHPKDGSKHMGKIDHMDDKGYTVKDDKTGEKHKFEYYRKLAENTEQLDEGMISYSEFKDKIAAHRKAGNKVVDDKYTDKKATYTTIDRDGAGRKVTHTPQGSKQEHLGNMKGDDDTTETQTAEKRGRGRPAGSKSGARR